jgi:hypothetical protein
VLEMKNVIGSRLLVIKYSSSTYLFALKDAGDLIWQKELAGNKAEGNKMF